jgi:hypothetical protein
MKNNYLVEVILFSNYTFRDQRQRKLVQWLGAAPQSAIGQQQEKTKKLFLKTLRKTPAIFMS